MSERSADKKARARAAAEGFGYLSQSVSLGALGAAGLRRHRGEDAASREVYLAHELPAE